MNTNLKSTGPAGSHSLKQATFGLLLGLGLSSPALAAGDAATSVAGWSIALVVILAVAYLFVRKKP